MNNFIIYNTHLTDDRHVYALGAEKTKWLIKHTATTTKVKIDYTKRQLLTHKAPLEPPKPYNKFFSGSEGLIGPPLPHLDCKDVPVVELLLYNQCNQYQGTAKDKQIWLIRPAWVFLTIKL